MNVLRTDAGEQLNATVELTPTGIVFHSRTARIEIATTGKL